MCIAEFLEWTQFSGLLYTVPYWLTALWNDNCLNHPCQHREPLYVPKNHTSDTMRMCKKHLTCYKSRHILNMFLICSFTHQVCSAVLHFLQCRYRKYLLWYKTVHHCSFLTHWKNPRKSLQKPVVYDLCYWDFLKGMCSVCASERGAEAVSQSKVN